MNYLTKLRIQTVITILLLCPLQTAWADNSLADGKIKNWVDKEEQQFRQWCDQKPSSITRNIYSDFLDEVKNMRIELCANPDVTLQSQIGKIKPLVKYLDRIFPSGNITQKLYITQDNLVQKTGELAQFETLGIIENNGSKYMLLKLGGSDSDIVKVNESQINACDELSKAYAANANCLSAISEFETAYNFAQSSAFQPLAMEVHRKLSKLKARWELFFEESKSQTLWELAINGMLFQKDNREHEFMEPPESQLVIFHPNIVIENVKNAPDGEQMKEAFMVEVIGVDYWESDDWYQPTGGSLVAVYSDRQDVKDWGYGVNVNFNSKLSIGASMRDGDELGIFVSLDLLKVIQDKKEVFKGYRDKLDFY